MHKRGQIAIFLIIAAVLVIGGLFLVLNFTGDKTFAEVEQVAEGTTAFEVKKFITDCFDRITFQSLFYFGMLGAEVEPDFFPRYFVIDEFYYVPYYYHSGKMLAPTVHEAEKDILALYVDQHLQECIGDFAIFPGKEIVFQRPRTTAQAADKEVFFSTNFPVSVLEEGKEQQLPPKYQARYPVRLKRMIEIARSLSSLAIQDDNLVRWDFMSDVSSDGFNITAYTEIDDTIVYRLVDLQNMVDNRHYILQFAHRVKI